jgi:hypothetical protein
MAVIQNERPSRALLYTKKYFVDSHVVPGQNPTVVRRKTLLCSDANHHSQSEGSDASRIVESVLDRPSHCISEMSGALNLTGFNSEDGFYGAEPVIHNEVHAMDGIGIL